MVEKVPGKRVVIAMDESEHSMFAFKWYVDKIRQSTDYLTLVHCAQYQNITYGAVTLLPGDPSLMETTITKEEKRISELLDKLQSLLQTHQIEGDVVRVHGEAGHALLAKAEELKADMIVTGSRGMGKIRRTVLGSTSDYLIHHAHVPVVVCKHPEHPVIHHHHSHHH